MSKKELKNKLSVVDGEVMGEVIDTEKENANKTAKEIFSYMWSILGNCNFMAGTAEIKLADFLRKAEEYGIKFIKY